MTCHPFIADLTQARLQELVTYDPATGTFVGRPAIGARRAGKTLGGINTDGYVAIDLQGRRYLAHRLAWLYVHGRWPSLYMDHISGSRSDNRLANLREATPQLNSQNLRAATAKSRSGVLGVRRMAKTVDRWQAVIRLPDGTNRSLGGFATREDASAAYWAAKLEHHAGCPKDAAQPMNQIKRRAA